MMAAHDMITLSLHGVNQWAFCDYRFWLMYGCGVMVRNDHVYRGRRHHRRVDRHAVSGGPEDAPVVRSLRVHHPTLGLKGVVDLLDRDGDGRPVPVETKAGRLRGQPWENDVLQVTAQALCIEHSLGEKVDEGMIFYAGSRRRARVEITPERRDAVVRACEDMRAILSGARQPQPRYAPRCEGCSLFENCLPHARAWLEQHQ